MFTEFSSTDGVIRNCTYSLQCFLGPIKPRSFVSPFVTRDFVYMSKTKGVTRKIYPSRGQAIQSRIHPNRQWIGHGIQAVHLIGRLHFGPTHSSQNLRIVFPTMDVPRMV